MKETIFRLLKQIAPEADPGALQPTDNIREELDIDSIDWLNFIVSLNEELGVEIPESDYDQLLTLEGLTGYLSKVKQA